MIKDNKSFNELVKYIDSELILVLSEEQCDKIYSLTVAAIALDERHKTISDRAIRTLSAARMETLPIKNPPPDKLPFFQWILDHWTYITVGCAGLALILYFQ